jgi:peptidoglycan hydrolase-like protein with peptidoglycan-binding domain
LQIQEQLTERGYHPGPIDGEWGRATSSELRRFQLDNNLPATGRPNPPTLRRLDISPEPPPPGIIRQIKEKLIERGYRPDPIDRGWGRATSSELRRFQLDNNLPPSGNPNPPTLERLGIYPDNRPPGPPPGPPPPPSDRPPYPPPPPPPY